MKLIKESKYTIELTAIEADDFVEQVNILQDRTGRNDDYDLLIHIRDELMAKNKIKSFN